MRIFLIFLFAILPHSVFSSTHIATEFYIDCVDMWNDFGGAEMTDDDVKQNTVLMGNKDTYPIMLPGKIACKIDKLEKDKISVIEYQVEIPEKFYNFVLLGLLSLLFSVALSKIIFRTTP